MRFYERREVRDALAYLRVLANPVDTVSLRRILNVPKRGIGDRAEAMVAAFADRERIPFGEALERARRGARHRDPLAERHRGFHRADGRGCARRRRPASRRASCSRPIYDRTGYLKELQESPDLQEQGRAENLEELVSVAREFEDSAARAARPGRFPRAGVARRRHRRDPGGDDHGGVVTLMTLHSAKGLEFPVVFLTGMEDGIFPHERTLGQPEELAEERRLAYVGITRAQQRLYLTRAVASLGAAGLQPGLAVPRRDPPRPRGVGPRRAAPMAPVAAQTRVAPRPGTRWPATGRYLARAR